MYVHFIKCFCNIDIPVQMYIHVYIYINQWLNFSKSIQLYRHNELVLIHDVHVYQNECMNLLKSAYGCTVLLKTKQT